MVPGVTINLGGTDFTVPPLTLGALEILGDRLESGDEQAVMSKEWRSLCVDSALAAINRNYPEMTRDQLLELIDVGNMVEVFEAIMDVSGLKRKAQETASGEVKGAAG